MSVKIFIWSLLMLGLNVHPISSQETVKSVQAVRTASPAVDGIFNDHEWWEGGKANDFIQKEPAEGMPSTEKTEAFFLYDDEYLYVGIKCYVTEPNDIVREVTGRDELLSSDWVEIHFDTFHDHRNAYLFVTTPGGGKCDGKYSEDGSNEDWSWDGVWWVESRVTEWGWSAEYKIPFSTLKFQKKDTHVWGMNILRWISCKNEWTSWQPCKRNDGIKISKDGHLEGLVGIQPGLNLEILPYITTRAQMDRMSPLQTRNENGITGLDVKYGFTSNLTAALTVNPDFAQIEADEDLINLGRYPLYLQEKRPFFTEGAATFNTAGNWAWLGRQSVSFYSRRINEPVYGLKVNGKIGKWGIGIFNALNDNDARILDQIAEGELPESIPPSAYYNVLRMTGDIFRRSQIGFYAMSKEFSGGFNRVIGLDAQIRLKNNYDISFEVAQSYTQVHSNRNHSIFLKLRHRSDFFSFFLRYREQGPGFFGNDLGFYDYNDFRENWLWIQVAPRPEKFGIRQIYHNINIWGENFQGARYFRKETLSGGWRYYLFVRMMNYWTLTGQWSQANEYDRFDHTLYSKDFIYIGLTNNRISRLFFDINHDQGKYRNGYYWSYNGTLSMRVMDRLRLELGYSRSLTRLPDPDTGEYGDNHYEVWRSKLYFYYNRDLNARVIFQYNGMENRLDTYYLIAYNFRPKSFLYLAYNERFDKAPFYDQNGIERFPGFGSSNRIFQLKFSYLFMI